MRKRTARSPGGGRPAPTWKRRMGFGLLLMALMVPVVVVQPHWSPCAHVCNTACSRPSKRTTGTIGCQLPCRATCLTSRVEADPWGTWDRRGRESKSTRGGRRIRFGDIEIVVPETHFPLHKLIKIAKELRVPLAKPTVARVSRVDLRGQFARRGVPIKNQSTTPTCMAHAMSTVMEYALWSTLRKAPANARKVGAASGRIRLSRKHLHSLSLHTLGICNRKEDYGGWALQAASRAQSEGTFAERYWPWKVWSPDQVQWRTCEEAMNGGEPTAKALAHRFFFIDSFHYLPPFSFKLSASARNPANIEGVLSTGKPLVLGVFLITSSFRAATRNGGFVRLPNNPKEAPDGGHYVVVVGYDRPRKRLVFANSWGHRFGRGGYGYMSYAYVQKYAIEGLYIDRMSVRP